METHLFVQVEGDEPAQQYGLVHDEFGKLAIALTESGTDSADGSDGFFDRDRFAKRRT